MWKARDRRTRISLCILLLALATGMALAAGMFCLLQFPALFDAMLRSELVIRPGSAAFKAWKHPVIPTKTRFFLFSVLNSDEVVAGGKPLLQEVGPFVYWEQVERVDEEFHDDGTVSFRTKKQWFPIEEESVSLDTEITTLNIPLFAAAEAARNNGVMELGIKLTLGWKKLFVKRTARQMLFEGVPDTLMAAGSWFAKSDVPMDRFGWFYGRNGTTWADDVIKMRTGAKDYNNLGDIVEWKGKTRTHYPDQCGQVRGTATGFMPVKPDRQHIDLFSPDICRPIRFDRVGAPFQHNHLPVTRFAVDAAQTFGNVSTNPANRCYHAYLPAGVHNLTGCKDAGILPVFVSLPHFLDADPSYLAQFAEGSMRPDPDRHFTAMVLQMNTSIPIIIQIRLQIILQLRSNANLGGKFGKLRNTFLPVIWFDAVATSTPEIETQVWYLLNIVNIVSKAGICVILVGLIAFSSLVCLVLRCISITKAAKEMEKNGVMTVNIEPLEPLQPLQPLEQSELL